ELGTNNPGTPVVFLVHLAAVLDNWDPRVVDGFAATHHVKELDPATVVVVLTGYGSIATAVESIKLGAASYLTKPADADQIVAAFAREAGDDQSPVNQKPMSVNRLEWEHIDRVLQEHRGNISETARALSMHRRTL